MCVPVDAGLPDLGLISPLPSGAPVTLTTTDGSPFRAFATRAAEPSGTGFVVLPDIRGLIPFYERLADALASVGFDSVAIDFYGRHEGLEPRDPDWDPWPTLDQMNYEQNLDDCGVAVEYLRSLGVEKVLTLGFCMGGALALHEGYSTHGLAGTVCAYGSPVAWADDWLLASPPMFKTSPVLFWACSAVPTMPSTSTTSQHLMPPSLTREGRTRSRSTTERRIASSTGTTPSGSKHRGTPGTGSWRSDAPC